LDALLNESLSVCVCVCAIRGVVLRGFPFVIDPHGRSPTCDWHTCTGIPHGIDPYWIVVTHGIDSHGLFIPHGINIVHWSHK